MYTHHFWLCNVELATRQIINLSSNDIHVFNDRLILQKIAAPQYSSDIKPTSYAANCPISSLPAAANSPITIPLMFLFSQIVKAIILNTYMKEQRELLSDLSTANLRELKFGLI